MFDKFWGRGNLQATREATAYLFKNNLYLGLQQSQKWKPLHLLYSILMNASVLVWLPLSFTLSYCFEFHKMTISQLLTSLQAAINIWGIPVKVFTRVALWKRLQEALNVMYLLDERCQRQDELRKIRHCAIIGNRWAIAYMVFYVVYSTTTMITSVSKGQPPYSLFMPMMDWRKSTLEFVAQSFIEFMLMNFACLHQCGNDAYTVIYIYTIRTHMQILVERVKRLGKDLTSSHEEHYEQLIMCIKDHQNLQRLVKTISPVISFTVFVQFAITAVILGATLINILMFADLSAQIASVVYLLAVMFQTSPCCYQATCLIDDSEQLSYAIFHCEWMDKDIRFRKLMLFFMMRSQMPMTLRAMKLFPITVRTSLAIAKFSFSLYTFIKNMDLGQK